VGSKCRLWGADPISIELIQPDSMPTAVRIVWPTAPTITTPARYNEVVSTAMRLLAEASTMWPESSKQAVVMARTDYGAPTEWCWLAALAD
jgi:hypothetical protein